MALNLANGYELACQNLKWDGFRNKRKALVCAGSQRSDGARQPNQNIF